MSFKGKPNIEWSEISWNSSSGCNGPGGVRCKGCWAYQRAIRMRGRFGYPREDPFSVVRHPDKADLPMRRKKPAVYFYCSMGDWLDPDMKAEWRVRDLRTMGICPRHIFVTLTKRYENLGNIAHNSPDGVIPMNVIVGISVTKADQIWGIDELRKVPAFIRLVCFEPLLEDLSFEVDLTGIGWIIIGARTRQGRTPAFQPEWEWVDRLWSEAQQLKIPVFLKPNLKYLGKVTQFPVIETPYEKIRKTMRKDVPEQRTFEEIT